jgi:hypothetical protein
MEGDSGTKKKRFADFQVTYQRPRPKIAVITPEGSIVFAPDYAGISGDAKYIISTNLLSYTFSEGVDDLAGSFTFSVENEMIKKTSESEGKSLFDLIPLRSIVNIYEDDEDYPVFRGIIRKRHNGAAMTAQGVKKSTIFSGKSIISCVTDFMVSLDIRIPNVSDATAMTKTLQSDLGEENMPVESFMKKTWDYFRQVSDNVAKSSGLVNGRLLDIIDNKEYIGEDFIKVTGSETSLQYPVATMFYNQNNNYITDVWRNILPKPAYELFTRFDEEKKGPVIMARQTPFGNPDSGGDWLNLKPYTIDAASLTGYELEQSDEEVYTAFASYVIGSPKAKEFYQITSQTDDTMQVNADKSAIYGFKLLSVSFLGFDRMSNGDDPTQRSNKLTTALEKLNKKTEYWFSRIDEMYSGTITLVTSFKKVEKEGEKVSINPRVGSRALFLGGQFYIEKTEHSWNYGRTPTNRLTVSRGMVYDADGKITEAIPDIGKLYGEQYK